MLLRVSLVSGSVVGLNIWQANKVHAAIPDTFEQPAKKKIRPSEVNEPIYQFSCFYFKQCWQFICHLLVKDWICSWLLCSDTTTTRTVLPPFVQDYPGEPVLEETPTHHPDHHPIFISFFHLPRSIASSLFKLCAWQSFCTTSFHVLFGLPLGLEPSTLYSIHLFTLSVSSFRSTCP